MIEYSRLGFLEIELQQEVVVIKEDILEKIILVFMNTGSSDKAGFEYYMDELKALTEAAGGQVAGSLVQNKQRPENATYIGSGKIEELKHLIIQSEADTVIFDRELSPVQLRNLEERLEIKVLDRTMLILDIFKQRAKSKEGKLQVELATLQYRLPRLRGKGQDLSRLGAGIGTRGAGEQKLELDRRYIRKRIKDIEKQIGKIEKTRGLHRKQRNRAGLKTISLVGYTNAGKSTLFNALCKIAHKSGHEQVEADKRLFQTLDTTTRRIELCKGENVLLVDTVGFIRELPHNLVAAFRSTLEEAVFADLILHVVDIADEEYLEKIELVEEVLSDLGADQERILTVFNKIDLLEDKPDINGVPGISAASAWGLNDLLETIRTRLNNEEFSIPK